MELQHLPPSVARRAVLSKEFASCWSGWHNTGCPANEFCDYSEEYDDEVCLPKIPLDECYWWEEQCESGVCLDEQCACNFRDSSGCPEEQICLGSSSL